MKKPAPKRRTKRTADKKKTGRPAVDRTALAKKRFLSSFGAHKGNVTLACKAARVGRSTYYEWLDADQAFRAQVEAAFEAVIDHVEDKLHKLIDTLEPAAIFFFLKTRAKKRGYVERQEVEGSLRLAGRLSIAEMKKSAKEAQDAGN